jgi:hypothetical protein
MFKHDLVYASRLAPIQGTQLAALSRSSYMKSLVDEGFVSRDAFAATKQLRNIAGEEPSASGENVDGIRRLRSLLAAHESECTANAFTIVAPHTHWEKNKLILISQNGGTYRVGPQDVNPHETYWPVSFCFTPFGLRPYEWADSSVLCDRQEFAVPYSVLRKVGYMASSRCPHLGLALNYRFKRLLSEAVIFTAEAPEGDSDLATVDQADLFLARHADSRFEQVGWAAFQTPKIHQSIAAEDTKFAIRPEIASALRALSERERNAVLKVASSLIEKMGSEDGGGESSAGGVRMPTYAQANSPGPVCRFVLHAPTIRP